MTALTAGRKIQRRENRNFNYPVAAGVKIFPGALVVITTGGYARPARTNTTDKVVGVAEQLADNTNGANGDIRVKTVAGTFNFVNSTAGDAIALGNVGDPAYVVDDQTVALTSNTNTRITAGKIIDVDSDGVWVNVGPGR